MTSSIHRSRAWPLDSQYGVSYRWSIWTDRVSCTVEILSFKHVESRPWPFGPFGVTWRHRARDRWIPDMQFPFHRYIMHRCWDIMCQIFSQTYSHWFIYVYVFLNVFLIHLSILLLLLYRPKPIHCNYQFVHYSGFCRLSPSILNRFKPNLQA